MYSTYESRFKEINGTDGVLNDYPDLKEPADPEEGAGMVALERWKTAVNKYSAELLDVGFVGAINSVVIRLQR